MDIAMRKLICALTCLLVTLSAAARDMFGRCHRFLETVFKDVRYLPIAHIDDGLEQTFYSMKVSSEVVQWESYAK